MNGAIEAIFIGRLSHDPELRTSAAGTSAGLAKVPALSTHLWEPLP
jgi:hypothetical protein